jgi:uncharacterized protein
MKKISFFLPLVFQLFFAGSMYAQKDVELINSGEALKKGANYYNEGEYQKAIDEYKRISRNDTNYTLALVELSVACIQDKQYENAYDYSMKGMALKGSYDYRFYNLAGLALKNMEKYQEAEKMYKEGLSKYPNDQYLYYNLAYLYEKQSKMDLAIKNYQNSIISNPLYSTPHYRLGRIYAVNEKPVQAMLALQTFLMLEPAGQSSFDVLKILEETVNNLLPPAGDSDRVALPKDNFEDLQVLIKSKVSLNKNYKNKTKLNYVLPKQVQLLMEKLTYDPNDKDFFMQMYVPYFAAANKEGYLEPLVYMLYVSVQNDEVQAILKKNLSKIKLFIGWSVNKMQEMRKFRPLVTENPAVKIAHHYYTNNKLQATGNFTDPTETKKMGEWTFYYSNGVMSGKEFYDENGKGQKEWRYYYNTGIPKGVYNYENGEQTGPAVSYHPNGEKSIDANIVKGKAEGEAKYYYYSGKLKQTVFFVKDEKEGPEVTYYPSGRKESEGNCKEGKREGEFKIYFETGELKEILNLKNNSRDGVYKEFFKNKNLSIEGNYKMNILSGTWNYYHENGKLRKSGNFNDLGIQVGNWKEYFNDGTLFKEYSFDTKGLLAGPYKEYTESGKLNYVYNYAADKVKDYKYFDEQGNVISEGKESKGILKMTSKRPDGTLIGVGDYKKGLLNGEWKFYDENESLDAVNNYKEGKLNGQYIEYHINGGIFREVNYKNGELDGLFKSYFRNGNLSSTGWFVEGNKQGDWYYYYSNGKPESHIYYLNDKKYGYNEYFSSEGILLYEELIEYDLVQKFLYYDSTGKKFHEISLSNGNGNFISKFPNGKIKAKGVYSGGNPEGDYTWYYPNGKVQTKGNYLYGNRNGKYTDYHEDGKVSLEKSYLGGEENGTWKWYHQNGNISKLAHYTDGMADSTMTFYFENGKVDFLVEYKDDMKNGIAMYYNPNGEIVCRKTYKDGRLISYSYLDKSGNYVPEISVKNETAVITAYHSNGNKSLEEIMEKGNYQGKRIFYYSNGKIEVVSNYKNGKREGEEITYYENGNVKSRNNYFYDEYDGAAQYFRENGTLEKEGNYKLDERHGQWKFYNASGKLIKTVTYVYGYPYEER